MESKKYIVLAPDGVHEYNLEVEITDRVEKYSIFASNNDCWTEKTKGTLLMSLEDDGNNLIFNKAITKKIEYYDGTYLLVLLKLRSVLDVVADSGLKIIEDKTFITL